MLLQRCFTLMAVRTLADGNEETLIIFKVVQSVLAEEPIFSSMVE